MAEQHWREVDGLVLPRPVAGHPVLELVNTFSGWDGAHASDYLTTYDHLAVLAGALGVLAPAAVPGLRHEAARAPDDAHAALERARTLRRAAHDAVLDPAEAAALDAVSEAAREAATSVVLEPGRPPTWHVTGRGPGDLDLPVAAFAWSAAQLLAHGPLDRVRACPGMGCGWLFLDTSGRRRWCDMAWCGNRAKARAHAARHRATQRAEQG